MEKDREADEEWTKENRVPEGMEGMATCQRFLKTLLATKELELNNQSLREFLKFALDVGMFHELTPRQIRLMKMFSKEDSAPLSKVQLHRYAERLLKSGGSKSKSSPLFLDMFGNDFLDASVVGFFESEDFASLMKACPTSKLFEWVARTIQEVSVECTSALANQNQDEGFSCEQRIMFNRLDDQEDMVFVNVGDASTASSSKDGAEQ